VKKLDKFMLKAMKKYNHEIKSHLEEFDKQMLQLTEQEIFYFSSGYIAGRLKKESEIKEEVKPTIDTVLGKVKFPSMNK
jgi:hypothetical protein